jgi:hypothetical protein
MSKPNEPNFGYNVKAMDWWQNLSAEDKIHWGGPNHDKMDFEAIRRIYNRVH